MAEKDLRPVSGASAAEELAAIAARLAAVAEQLGAADVGPAEPRPVAERTDFKMTLYASPSAADELDQRITELKVAFRPWRVTSGQAFDAMLAVLFAHMDEVEAKLKEGLR